MLDFNDFKSLAQLCETNIGLAPVHEMLAALQFFQELLDATLKTHQPIMRHGSLWLILHEPKLRHM